MDKNKALDAAVQQIERAFGKGSIMRMGARTGDERSRRSPPARSGSTSHSASAACRAAASSRSTGRKARARPRWRCTPSPKRRRRGGTCAFIDAEHALDPIYARKLGVDVDNLLISQPDTGEQGLEIADTLVRSGAIDVLVIDSVAALVPRAELEGEMGDAHVGLHARLMSQALRKITGSVSRSNTMLVFLNQIRLKIGVMFGNPETTTGGNALKFYASIRLEIRRVGSIKDRDQIVGNQTRVKVVKNKLAPPFRQVEFDIMYGEGISKVGELIDLGVKANVVEKSGAWYSVDSQRIGQGRENAKQFLREHQDVAASRGAAAARPVRHRGDRDDDFRERGRGGRIAGCSTAPPIRLGCPSTTTTARWWMRRVWCCSSITGRSGTWSPPRCAAVTGGSGPACISAPPSAAFRSAPKRSRLAARCWRATAPSRPWWRCAIRNRRRMTAASRSSRPVVPAAKWWSITTRTPG